MKTRFIDTIYRIENIKPAEIKPHPPKPVLSSTPKPKKHLWLRILGGGFLILFIFGFLFWQGLLGEKMALLRLFLGLNGKYLVLFQNNTELRPAGGFIGSFAEIEFKNGLIKNYYFETNIYKKDKKFVAQTCIPSPAPAQKIWPGGCLDMKDSNWSPDFQEAAEQVAWFYKQEGGNRVDGVIAMDTTLFTELLKLTGPIEMPEYNLTLNSENFVKETQYYVEKEYFEEPENKAINEPKTILKDMMPKVLAKLKNPKLASPLLNILEKNLSEKHLLFSFKDRALSNIVLKNNWAGEVKNTNSDYLYINNANLGGMKSSLNVKQKITLKSQIQDDKTILNTLTIVRTHQGNGIWPDGTNQNYTRVLVPKGSILQSKRGVEEIDFQEELGKTVYGFWTTVAPGETKTFEISYLLPFRKDNKYSLLVQKQPGALADQFNFILEGASRWKWNGVINQDKEISIDLGKEK